MSGNRLPDYLSHILQTAQQATDFIKGMDDPIFVSDPRTEKAVVMCLLIIGETATRIMDQYPNFVLKHQDIQWQSMRNMRNRMAHGYFNLDLWIVWDTTRDIPILLKRVAGLRDQS